MFCLTNASLCLLGGCGGSSGRRMQPARPSRSVRQRLGRSGGLLKGGRWGRRRSRRWATPLPELRPGPQGICVLREVRRGRAGAWGFYPGLVLVFGACFVRRRLSLAFPQTALHHPSVEPYRRGPRTDKKSPSSQHRNQRVCFAHLDFARISGCDRGGVSVGG